MDLVFGGLDLDGLTGDYMKVGMKRRGKIWISHLGQTGYWVKYNKAKQASDVQFWFNSTVSFANQIGLQLNIDHPLPPRNRDWE